MIRPALHQAEDHAIGEVADWLARAPGCTWRWTPSTIPVSPLDLDQIQVHRHHQHSRTCRQRP
ncbi:hypothetical protein [Streptomyces sioyaensis]|uniref:hypothetical protein n=1 Tax=Streptomyces sioyaensis TaxID=67364 RepID=UPI0036E92F67